MLKSPGIRHDIGIALAAATTLCRLAWSQAPEPARPTMEADTHRILCNETYRVELPPKPHPDAPAFLSFEARIEAGRFQSGSAPACIIAVNGIPTSLERLRNKAPWYAFNPEQRVFWYTPSRGAWVFSYYPWENTTKAGGHVNRFVLDIGDLMTPNDNAVVFHSIYRYGANDKPLEIRNVEVLFSAAFPTSSNLSRRDPPRISRGLDGFRQQARARHDGAYARLNTTPPYRDSVDTVAPTRSYTEEFAVSALSDGRIRVAVGGDTYDIDTALRFAGEPWRYLSDPNRRGSWQHFATGQMGIRGRTEHVTWRRDVVKQPSHVEIRERWHNRSGDDQPIMFVNMIDLGSVENIREFRLAGRMQTHFYACTSPMKDRMTGTTPVAYAARPNSAVGMVLEDDASRNQATWMTWDSVLAAGNDLFYLPPGASHTIVWKIYPLRTPDYYRLVNAIRHDWGLFQEIPGLFGFVHPWTEQRMYEDARYKTAEERIEFVRNTGIRIAAASAPYRGSEDKRRVLYGGEPLSIHEQAIASVIEWRDMVKPAIPELACLPYVDVHLCRLTDGETLDELRTRFPDSLPLNAWNEPVAYRPGWLYCILPRKGNSVERHLTKLLELYVDRLGLDGLYLDEWDHSRARVSYGHSDGLSALTDADGHITRKIGFVPILSKDFHLAFARKLTDRGAVIVANQFDDTLATAQLPIIHFAEPVDYDSYLLRAAQLSRTPLSLHLKPRVNLFETVREFLKQGILTCYYWYYLHGDHILKRCYPITVREIRPGIVFGDDRIVTCVSGSYTLRRRHPLRAYVYGAPDGTLTRTVTAPPAAEDQTTIELNLSAEEAAVIIEYVP